MIFMGVAVGLFIGILVGAFLHLKREMQEMRISTRESFQEHGVQFLGLKDHIQNFNLEIEHFKKDIAEFQNSIGEDEMQKMKDRLSMMEMKAGIYGPSKQNVTVKTF